MKKQGLILKALLSCLYTFILLSILKITVPEVLAGLSWGWVTAPLWTPAAIYLFIHYAALFLGWLQKHCK